MLQVSAQSMHCKQRIVAMTKTLSFFSLIGIRVANSQVSENVEVS